MGNILRHELKAGYKASLAWSLALSAMVYVFMYLFPSIAHEHAKWDSLIHQLPPGVLAGFGMNQLQISNIFGYYGTQIYDLLVLFLAIYAVMQFAGPLAREESDGTIEFLAARPVSRTDIVLAKAAASTLLAIGGNVVLFLATWASFAEFHTRPFALSLLVWFSLGLLLVTLVFGGLGLALAAFLPQSRTLNALTIGLAFATYFLGIASAMSHKLAGLRYVSPYEYVSQTTIWAHQAIPAGDWLGLLVVAILGAALAALRYRTKDLGA